LRIVRIEDIAKDLNLPFEAVLNETTEFLKGHERKKKGKYFLFQEPRGVIFVIDHEDVEFIIHGLGKLSFIDLLNKFQTKESPESLNWILGELFNKNVIDEKVFRYYTEVKDKPSIRAWFDPRDVQIGDEVTLIIEVNTLNEIDKPKVSIRQPTAVKLIREPIRPSKIYKGRSLFAYIYQAERHGTYKFDVRFEGLVQGIQLFSENFSPELVVRPFKPEITVDVKVARLLAYYDMECSVNFIITNNGKGDARNAEFKGFERYPEFLVLSEINVGTIAANSKLMFPIRLKPKKSGLYSFNKLTLVYEDLQGNKFECVIPEFEINVSTLKPRILVDLIPPPKVHSIDQAFVLRVRISNVGEGRAKNIKFDLPVDSKYIIGGPEELLGGLDLDVNQSVELIFELKPPEKGEIKISDFILEFEDIEGNKFTQECKGIVIGVEEIEKPILREQLPWPFREDDPIPIGGRFKIVKWLGEGNFAKVFLAKDTFRKTEVALKALKPYYISNLSVVDDFVNEANIAMELREDHIVCVYSVEKEEFSGIEYPFIVMEYVEGGSLADKILSGESLSFPEIINIIHDVCMALNYAHNHPKKIVHCDVSPSNIFFDENIGLWKLGDFGLARMALRDEKSSLRRGGKYTAPEIRDGLEPSDKSDVYSLGMVFKELLIGDVRGDMSRLEKIHSKVSPEIIQAVKLLIKKMTDPDPSQRPSIKDVLTDIRKLQFRTGLEF
jgi:hypothetical protein